VADDHLRQVSSILGELNGRIRALGERFEGPEGADGVFPFICECGADGCQQKVELSLTQFDALKLSDGMVLAVGHELTQAQLAHRRALRLCEEAKALGAQAEHQNKRARRNIRGDVDNRDPSP
jgi:hypothetical protein